VSGYKKVHKLHVYKGLILLISNVRHDGMNIVCTSCIFLALSLHEIFTVVTEILYKIKAQI